MTRHCGEPKWHKQREKDKVKPVCDATVCTPNEIWKEGNPRKSIAVRCRPFLHGVWEGEKGFVPKIPGKPAVPADGGHPAQPAVPDKPTEWECNCFVETLAPGPRADDPADVVTMPEPKLPDYYVAKQARGPGDDPKQEVELKLVQDD